LNVINVRHYNPAVLIRSAQSFLFVPADEPERVAKAARAGADAVILDLEDAVADARKAEARAVAERTLRERPGPSAWLVRINGSDSSFFADDLELVARAAPDGVVVPKADPRVLERINRLIPPIIALIETAAGLGSAREVAADPRVERLQLGAVDLALELGLRPRPDGLELLHPRATLVLASALAGCAAPVDSVFVGIRDLEGLERDAELGRSLGCSGKACIHPTHLEVLHRVFRPTAAEVERAMALLEAYDRVAGAGAVQHDGAMVDRPLVEQARRIVEAARGT
jgi:citrate lyase beta subunit